MNMPISQPEKAILQQKRQALFSLWNSAGEGLSRPAQLELRKPQLVEHTQRDEIQALIQRFSDPNSDRLFVEQLYS